MMSTLDNGAPAWLSFLQWKGVKAGVVTAILIQKNMILIMFHL